MTTAQQSILIVCPTEYGGQIEHAADLAIAVAARDDVDRCVLLTRPGARRYLGEIDTDRLSVIELLPPRRLRTGLWSRVSNAPLQLVDLLRENLIVRRVCSSSPGPLTMVLETTKYPMPRLLTGRTGAKVVLFVHNAQPHFDLVKATLRQRFLLRLERWCLAGSDLAVTHGSTQLATIAEYSSTPTRSVPLPRSSALPAVQATEEGFEAKELLASLLPHGWDIDAPFALCIGEIRPNKGTELAIKAAGAVGIPLLVAGKSDGDDHSRQLSQLAQTYPHVEIRDAFLDAREFDLLVRSAALIVLPYSHFDAQSGVLSKAMNAGRSVLASDLKALMDQADAYPQITFADPNFEEVFAQALRSTFETAVLAPAGEVAAQPEQHGVALPKEDWQLVAAAVVEHADY